MKFLKKPITYKSVLLKVWGAALIGVLSLITTHFYYAYADVVPNSIKFTFTEPISYVYLSSTTPFEGLRYELTYAETGKIGKEHSIPSTNVSSATNGVDPVYTSELLTFDVPITSIRVFPSTKDLSEELNVLTLDKSSLNSRAESVVLGSAIELSDGYTSLDLFRDSGVNVVSRLEWDPAFESNNSELASIDKVIFVPVNVKGTTETPISLIGSINELHSNRCIDNSGRAPIDCSNEDTWGDISFNYILDQEGTLYEGRTGGHGTKSLFYADGISTVVVAILIDGEPSADLQSSFRTVAKILSDLYSLDRGSSQEFQFKNVTDSTDFDRLVDIANEDSSSLDGSPQGVLLKDLDLAEVATFAGKVQMLVQKSSSEPKDTILKTAQAVELETPDDKSYETFLVDSEIAEQVANEIMLADPDVLVQPNRIYRLNTWDNTDANRSIPSDYTVSTQWNHEKIMAPEVWSDMGGCVADNLCGGDPSIIVAVLDTGVAYEDYNFDAGQSYSTVQFDPFFVEIPGVDIANGVYNEGYDREYTQAPELANINFVSPYDAWQEYSCNTLRLTGGAPDPCSALELAKINHANDDFGHGTFVTGVIAANTGDSSPNNIVGIAHNVSIMPVKVFTPNDKTMCQDQFGGLDLTCADSNYDYRTVAFTTTIVDGIDHAIANGAKVINMSLGGPGSDSLVNTAINDARVAGAIVVVAAGNDGDDAQYYFPANSPGAFVVGATNDTDGRAYYSNYGDEIDLVAPVGGSAGNAAASLKYGCSTDNTCSDETDPNLFKTFTSQTSPLIGVGTSYAAPQVAAAAALLWSDTPTSTLAEIEAALRNSAIDLGTPGKDSDFGYGLLDIEAALGREVTVPDPVNNDLYFTWYDTSSTDKQAWVLVGNPSATETAAVGIDISTVIDNNYNIAANGRITPKWSGILDGPVIVTSNKPVYSTQRVLFQGSFNEFSGIPAKDLTNKYYFTWYDTSSSDKKAWILVGNPSDTQTANVNIKIGNNVVNQNFSIPPGGRITPKWAGKLDGPVIVTSDINVYTTQRVLFQGYFNEFAGIPVDSLNDEYYFTWYDTSSSDKKAWVLVGNPSTTTTANVNIKVGNNVVNENFSIPPGGRVTPKWTGILDGPVVVTSDTDVYATQRVTFDGAFNEFSGIPFPALSKKYYFTWYDTSASDKKTWILVGNPSSTQSASVNIKIGTKVNQNFTIPPGGRVTPKWSNILDGPVVVTSNINVYATQRVLYQGDFNEYPGIVVE